MIIEQAQPSEFAEIEKVFQNCFADDVRMYAVKRAKHLFVAKDDGQIVGAGGLFVNSLHAKIPKAAIAVEVGYRKRNCDR